MRQAPRPDLALAMSLLIILPAAPLSGQGPEVRVPDLNLDSLAIGMVTGAAATYSVPHGEAFEHLGAGPGFVVFVGFRFRPVHEVRVGGFVSRHADFVNGGTATMREAFAEAHWALERGRLTLRAGPRVAWTFLSAPNHHRSSSSLGLTIAPQVDLGRSWVVDGGISGSYGTFPPRPPANPQMRLPGTVWSVRLGVAWLPSWGSDSAVPSDVEPEGCP